MRITRATQSTPWACQAASPRAQGTGSRTRRRRVTADTRWPCAHATAGRSRRVSRSRSWWKLRIQRAKLARRADGRSGAAAAPSTKSRGTRSLPCSLFLYRSPLSIRPTSRCRSFLLHCHVRLEFPLPPFRQRLTFATTIAPSPETRCATMAVPFQNLLIVRSVQIARTAVGDSYYLLRRRQPYCFHHSPPQRHRVPHRHRLCLDLQDLQVLRS